jgi:hypothetical protein
MFTLVRRNRLSKRFTSWLRHVVVDLMTHTGTAMPDNASPRESWQAKGLDEPDARMLAPVTAVLKRFEARPPTGVRAHHAPRREVVCAVRHQHAPVAA